MKFDLWVRTFSIASELRGNCFALGDIPRTVQLDPALVL
jgi:hypothetical protein